MPEFRDIDLCFFQLVDVRINIFQFGRAGRPEIFSTGFLCDLFQHLFIDLYFHILVLNSERSLERVRRGSVCADADCIDTDVKSFCKLGRK